MTSFALIPAPPDDVAAHSALYCVGGLNGFSGETPLAPEKRPDCLLVFVAFSGTCDVRTLGAVFAVASGGLLAVPVEPGPLFVHAPGQLGCVWALLTGAQPLEWAQRGETLPQTVHSPAEGMLRALWHTAQLGGAADGWWGSAQAYSLLMKLRAQAAQAAATVPPLVEGATAIIRTDFAYLGGVEDLADRLGVSKSHLIRCFTEHLGVSPGKYLTATRMEYAKLLLQSGRYNLETVAGLVGISGANYFCKLFKAHSGLTPGAYSAFSPRAPQTASEPDQRFYL